jgi:hypothetical protein
MLDTAGLSLEQGPRISVPFRFFLTAPLFACAAGLLLVWQGDGATLARWTPAALAVVHLLALGFLTQVMCGALFQMLPVLAGAPIPQPVAAGRWTHGLLSAGTPALCFGFLGGGPVWLELGAALVGASLVLFVLAAGRALLRAAGVAATIAAMRLSLAALTVTVGLGLTLVAGLSGWISLARFTDWVDVHLSWGLLGWAGILIMGVGFQVVPMFHVTPPYPPWLRDWAAPLATLGLTAALVLTGLHLEGAAVASATLPVTAFAAFALVTLHRQHRRQRRRLDATLLHWWSAIASALAAAVIWLAHGPDGLLGVLVLVGVGIGLPSAMLLKIVPFLSWFHLQHMQVAARRFDYRLPTMQGFIPERAARVHLGAHLTALALLVGGVTWLPGMVRAGGLALAVSSALLAELLATAATRYRRHAAAMRGAVSTEVG